MSTMPFFQPSIPPLPANLDFQGQTGIGTGANSGLGLEFSRQFLVRNASTLVLAVCKMSKDEKTKAALLADADLHIRKSKTRADIRVMQFDAESDESTEDCLGDRLGDWLGQPPRRQGPDSTPYSMPGVPSGSRS